MPGKFAIDLNRSGWLSKLPQSQQDEVARSAVRMTLKRGRYLFRQGDPANGLFGIVGGEAQVIGTTIAGLDILVAMHRPGDWTGYLSCLDEGPYTFSVVTSQVCEVLHLPLPAVRRIFLSDAEGFRQFVQPELAATRVVYSHIIEHLAFTPLQRLARRLIDLTSPPHGEEMAANSISPITQDQLAISVMTSRQWTNRLLQHLEQAGLVSVSRSRIDIRDRPRLEQLAVHGESGFTMADPVAVKV